MPLFRKRPVVVEAEQFLVGQPLPFNDRGPYVCFDEGFYVITVHGQRTAVANGDWIILEQNSRSYEFRAYPCKPNIFDASYKPVVPLEQSPCPEPELSSQALQRKSAVWTAAWVVIATALKEIGAEETDNNAAAIIARLAKIGLLIVPQPEK